MVRRLASVSTAESALAACEALIGTEVTVTRLGAGVTQVTVLDVVPAPEWIKLLANACGGAASGQLYWLEMIWRVRKSRPS